MRPLKYNQHSHKDFQTALKKNIRKYFHDTHQHMKGNTLMVVKVIFFVVWMLAGYVVLFSSKTFTGVLFGYLFSGTGALLTVISAGHDASHKALSKNQMVNRWFRYTWGLLGLSPYLWELKHHKSHHTFTNIIRYDQDISQSKLIRLNPAEPYARFHKYQKYYAPFVYLLFGLFAITWRDFALFRIKEYGITQIEHKRKVWVSLIMLKMIYFGLNLVLPLLIIPLPPGQIILAFLITVSLTGIYIILVLAIPHINRQTVFKCPPPDGILDTDWYTHAIDVTVDASPQSPWLNWFTGGLNTHTVHHLFPHICHIHYLHLTPIVKQTAKAFGLKYNQESLLHLIYDHFKLLTELGEDPEKASQYLQKQPQSPMA